MSEKIIMQVQIAPEDSEGVDMKVFMAQEHFPEIASAVVASMNKYAEFARCVLELLGMIDEEKQFN